MSAPVTIDAGRPGVARYELRQQPLPGDRGVLVNVISYGSRGVQFGVGVMDAGTGRVKVVVEDGGNATYVPTGHLVFARGDVILAAPFDLDRNEVRGAPAAVWGGLDAPNRAFPARFRVSNQGALAYRPGLGSRGRAVSILGADGKVEPWSTERWDFDGPPIPSPDGRRMAAQILDGQGIDQLWTSPVDHADFVKITTEANVDVFSPACSPDSRRLAYQRVGKDDRDGVYVRDVDGGEARRVVAATNGVWLSPSAWLPDGTALLLTQSKAGKAGIWRLPLSDAETDASRLVPYLPSEFNRGGAILSNDGRQVAFRSDETGAFQAWVADVRPGGEPGKPIQVRTQQSTFHAWAPDGKALFIQDARGRLMKAVLNAGASLSVSTPVEVANLATLRVVMWMPLPGGRVLVVHTLEGENDITRYDMVLNWTAVLGQKVPVK